MMAHQPDNPCVQQFAKVPKARPTTNKAHPFIEVPKQRKKKKRQKASASSLGQETLQESQLVVAMCQILKSSKDVSNGNRKCLRAKIRFLMICAKVTTLCKK